MAFDAGAAIGKLILDASNWAKNSKVAAASADALKGAFNIAAKATAAVGAALVAAVLKADKFQKAFANVSTLVDTSTVNIQAMQNQLLALDDRLGSATDLTDGLYQALSASVEPAKAVEFVGEAAKFAKAALVDTNTAVDVITTGLNAYGLAADKATGISDVLFQTIRRGKVTGEQLSATIGQIIPLAANMELSFENLGASIATMTRQGVNSAEATTQLQAVMTSLLKPSSELQEAMKKAGFETGEAVTSSENFQEALQQVINQTDGSQEALAQLFPNVRALRGALALTGEGAKGFTADLDAMTNSAGATEEAFEKQRLTFETLGNKIEKVAIKIGTRLLPAADSVVSGFGEALDELTANNEVMDSLQRTGDALGKHLKNLTPIFAGLLKAVAFVAETFTKGTEAVIDFAAGVVDFLTPASVKSKIAIDKQKEALRLNKEEFEKANPILKEYKLNTEQLTSATLKQINVALQSLRVQADQRLRVDGDVFAYKLLTDKINKLQVQQQKLMDTGGGVVTILDDISNSAGGAEDSIDDLGEKTIEVAENMYEGFNNFYQRAIEGNKEFVKKIGEDNKAAVEKIGKDYEDMAKTITGNFGNVFEALGAAIVNQEDGFENLKKAALSAIAAVVRGFGEQWALQAAAALVPAPIPNFAAAAGWAAASVAAFVASGLIKSFEGGGIAQPGLALVGEQGPELVNLGSTSRIFPADETRGLVGGGVTMKIIFTGPVNSDIDLERTMMKAGRKIEQRLRQV
jgi:TP901 family phage tail tape measure protein